MTRPQALMEAVSANLNWFLQGSDWARCLLFYYPLTVTGNRRHAGNHGGYPCFPRDLRPVHLLPADTKTLVQRVLWAHTTTEKSMSRALRRSGFGP